MTHVSKQSPPQAHVIQILPSRCNGFVRGHSLQPPAFLGWLPHRGFVAKLVVIVYAAYNLYMYIYI